MAKPLLQLAAVALAGVALWKVASIFFFPLLFWALKVAVIVGLILLAIWFFTRKTDKHEDTGDAAGPP